ncbi:MAG: hypothetical protein P4L84_33245 [Isosphaeraceae bacterium]|nr:hypothetical protein [Isosphaeraceae bacterium]
MLTLAWLVGIALTGQTPQVEPAHAAHGAYRSLLENGLTLEQTRLEFPPPALRDGMSAEEQRASLEKIAGSSARLDELVRDSVAAPFLLKLRDETTKDGDLIRRGDLFFAVHADFRAIDPDALTRRGTEEKPVEAGNMRFVSRVLTDGERHARGFEGAGKSREWFVHLKGRLLDRIAVEATDRITSTGSDESWVIASRTEPKFDEDHEFPNSWRSLDVKGGGDASAAHRYAGGGSYVKISKLAAPAGALFVEAHFAFTEPRAWFDGAPILRSKLSLVAQDQIRRLRRELAQAKSKSKSQ